MGRFRITHPFHPLCGAEYELVTRRLTWGEDRVFYYDLDGKLKFHLETRKALTSTRPRDDECLYVGEYNARKGYQFSETNNLIFNLKKPMDRRGQAGWAYKRRAIETAGKEMRQAVDALNEKWLSIATLVPMPPSRVKTDQMYDDRLIQMLQVLRTGIEVDVRELIVQRESTDPAHTTDCAHGFTNYCKTTRSTSPSSIPPRA